MHQDIMYCLSSSSHAKYISNENTEHTGSVHSITQCPCAQQMLFYRSVCVYSCCHFQEQLFQSHREHTLGEIGCADTWLQGKQSSLN